MFSENSAILPLITALTLLSIGGAATRSAGSPMSVPVSIAVNGELPPPPKGVIDLKFGDFFKMPVGPLGLEPTGKLLGLDGRRVRIIGYLARQDVPTNGLFYLTPFPVELSEEDEHLADDLPPTTVFVSMPSGNPPTLHSGTLVRLTGRLLVGAKEEPDGRVSTVRLIPDPEIATALSGSPMAPDNK